MPSRSFRKNVGRKSNGLRGETRCFSSSVYIRCVARQFNECDIRRRASGPTSFRSANSFGSSLDQACLASRDTRTAVAAGNKRLPVSRKRLLLATLFAAWVAGLFSVLIKVIASGRARVRTASVLYRRSRLFPAATLSISSGFFHSVTSESGNFKRYYRDILAGNGDRGEWERTMTRREWKF